MAAFGISHKNPTEVFDQPFLYAQCKDADEKYGNYDKNDCGKWMMFFNKNVLDDKWKEACRLFYGNHLIGIHSMKVSTGYSNPRASNNSSRVIIFYCGPCNDEAKMIEYGKNLLNVFPYRENPYMYYKSDSQTQGGTKATGQKVNSLYKLSCK